MNGQFETADVLGEFNRGRQFSSNAELNALKQQSNKIGIQQQVQDLGFGERRNEQVLQTGDLNIKNTQSIMDQRDDKQKNQSLFNTALQVSTASDDQIIPILMSNIERVRQLGGDAKESIAALQLAESGDYDGVRTGADNLIEVGVRQGDLKPREKDLIKQSAQTPQIPDVLLQDLSPSLAPKAAAAFSAAGGGKDGLSAYQKIVDTGTEQQRRQASPAILKANFPQATKAESTQLQGAMDAAKTTESGLQAASKVRVEQQRLKKAKVFQKRGIELLDNILTNPELNDVVGSIEGSDESVIPFGGTKIRSDGEANAIADITEAGNIFTADNLKLMSGVLSETDIKILSNLAGGALNRLRGEDRFREDVQDLRDRLSSELVVTIDDRDAKDVNAAALEWANANPNDPRAAAIMQKLEGNQ
jgi:hypothetical protein